MGYFETHSFDAKTAELPYWATFETIEVLFIFTSGHTESEPAVAKQKPVVRLKHQKLNKNVDVFIYLLKIAPR